MRTTTFGIGQANPVRALLRLFLPTARRSSASCEPKSAVVNAAPAAGPLKKILIVDDDVIILKTTSLKLKSQGYAVLTAMDAAAAIQAVREEHPDLVLLDLSFSPDVAHGGTVAWDGFSLMSWLRRLEESRHIPVIIITGSDPAKCKQRAMGAGALAYFHKPIEHAGLLSAIQQVLDKDADRRGPVFDLDFHICF